jgi:Protein kinase domain/D-mannose binding lectin/PAN-like domain
MEKLSCSIILLLCSIHLTCATHILLPGESLNSNQSLVSQNGEFKFGFLNLGSWYTDHCYIGIWFTYEDLDWNYVWIGNTQSPVNLSLSYALNLSRNGNLILTQSHEQIWSTNVEKREQNSTILVLLDTGNLVLRDHTNSSKVIWQSFDHPTDTWLPGAWLELNNENGKSSLVSRVDDSDPSAGAYSVEMNEIWDFIVTDKYNNRSYTGTFPSWLPIQYNNGFITINPPYYVTVNMEGGVNIWKRAELLYGFHLCTLNCGPFGLCISNFGSGNYSCQCPYGFRPTSSEEFSVQNYSAGCVRNVSLNCTTQSIISSNNYTFHQLDNLLQWPYDRRHMSALSKEKCENACLRNCSCTGFAWRPGYCYPLYGELWDIIISDDVQIGESIYIRLAISSNFVIKGTYHKNIKLIVGVVIIIVIVCFLLIWIFIRRFLCVKVVNFDYYLSCYTYNQMKNATKSFSTKLGEGGFGCVFKGQLIDYTKIAVKKLKVVGQEEKQFRTEVQTLGMIRHSNLVGLLGFCAEGKRRLLVYEYMPNGSLDSHLFKEGSNILSWKNRYKISVGIARGLAYLHEQCRDCIIHCDIKPENVLLDEQFSPKIADFGLAKLLGRDFSRVLTTMRGTIGYMAPEWISGEAITQKADVYSFGMMLFEIISGRRNAGKFNNTRYPYFPLYATKKMNEGEVICLLDKNLGVNVNAVELIHACKVAGWCIQDSEARRPSMGKVVLMLQGVIDVGIPPVPHSLLNIVDAENYSFDNTFEG